MTYNTHGGPSVKGIKPMQTASAYEKGFKDGQEHIKEVQGSIKSQNDTREQKLWRTYALQFLKKFSVKGMETNTATYCAKFADKMLAEEKERFN